jgi:hypothetical protein
VHGLCEEAGIKSNIGLRSDPQHILRFRVETVELSAVTVHGASKLALAGAMAVAGIAIATLDHRDGGLWSLESTQCLKRVITSFRQSADHTQRKSRPKAALQLKSDNRGSGWIVAAAFDFRRYAVKLTPAKPTSNIARVERSGIASVSVTDVAKSVRISLSTSNSPLVKSPFWTAYMKGRSGIYPAVPNVGFALWQPGTVSSR